MYLKKTSFKYNNITTHDKFKNNQLFALLNKKLII